MNETTAVVTVVDALRRAPKATAALVNLFTALHDPAISRKRDAQVSAMREA